MNSAAEDPESSALQLADHLFRHESGKMVAILTGIYGTRNLQLAEDAVQEALERALATWPFGVPANPSAWLLRTAKNLAIDHLRREKNFLEKQAAIIVEMESSAAGDTESGSASGVGDDLLRMIFVCCHPVLTAESQSALALKTLCGFGPTEIANAFLISEAAVAKRLVRARQKLRSANVPFQIPTDEELPARLDSVLETLYLLFNEGHKATCGDEIIRADLCMEAIRLCTLLANHPAGDEGRTHAMLALMCLTAARLPARTDAQGNLLLLEDQDRSRWDGRMIQAGFHHLARSSESAAITPFHLQAGIAACHASAPNDAATDWPRILSLYDHLSALQPSPVVTLNRAVAISKVHGPAAAIGLIESDATTARLENKHLLHSVLGDLEFRCGEYSTAARHFRRALELATTKPERALIVERLERCLSHEST